MSVGADNAGLVQHALNGKGFEFTRLGEHVARFAAEAAPSRPVRASAEGPLIRLAEQQRERIPRDLARLSRVGGASRREMSMALPRSSVTMRAG